MGEDKTIIIDIEQGDKGVAYAIKKYLHSQLSSIGSANDIRQVRLA